MYEPDQEQYEGRPQAAGADHHRRGALYNPAADAADQAVLEEVKEKDEEDELLEYVEDMGEFLVGKKNTEPEKIKIYKAPKKKQKEKEPENILEMDFSDNRSLVEEFAAIVAGGAELVPDEDEKSDDNDNWEYDEAENETEPVEENESKEETEE